MATSSCPPVPIAMGSGSTATEESRAFFQSRLALFGQSLGPRVGGYRKTRAAEAFVPSGGTLPS